MMPQTNIDKLHIFLANRSNRRRVTAFGIIIIVVLIFFGIASANSLVSITYQADDSTDSTQIEAAIYNSTSGEKTPLSKVFGRYVVPRGTKALIFSHDASRTTYNAPQGFGFGLSQITIPFNKPVTGTKLSSGGQDCPLATKAGMFSYSCLNPTTVKRYSSLASGIPQQTVSAEFISRYTPARYGDGILAWYSFSQLKANNNSTYSAVSYIRPDQLIQRLKLPGDSNLNNSYVEIVTDNTDVNNTGFVVNDVNNGLSYFYRNFAEDAKPKVFKRQRAIDFDKGEASSCVLKGAVFTCYNGARGASDDDGSGATPGGGDVEMIDLNSNATTTTMYNNERFTGLDELFRTSDGSLYARSGHNLLQLRLDNDSFSTSVLASDVGTVAAGISLYYTQNNRVYQYDPATQTATLHYQSDTETIRSLVARGSDLLSVSISMKDPLQLLNVYRL